MNEISAAIERCFGDQSEENLRDLDGVLRRRIYAILASVRRSPEFVEDAYQSAFIKYLGILRDGKKTGINYEAYFVVVAKNCLLDELRKEGKRIPLDDIEEELLAGEHGAAEVEAGIIILEAMSKLDRRCQFLLESHYINSLSDQEIAKRLSIEPKSVPVLVSRCKTSLLQALKRRN